MNSKLVGCPNTKIFFYPIDHNILKSIYADVNTSIPLVQHYTDFDFNLKFLLQSIDWSKNMLFLITLLKVIYWYLLKAIVFRYFVVYQLFGNSWHIGHDFPLLTPPMVYIITKKRENYIKITITAFFLGGIFPYSRRICCP